MKAILMSIHPVWCEKIFSGIKTIEVRKTRPKLMPPFKVYVYMTATKERFPLWEYVTAYQDSKGDIVDGSQKVIGSFICDWITKVEPRCDVDDCVNQYIHHYPAILGNDCLSFRQLKAYLGKKGGYDWHITEPKLFDTPKKLSDFRKPCVDKYEYCQGCKHGLITIPQDEEEYALYHGGYYDTFDTVCLNTLSRPPQSWCYVEEQK